MPVHHEVSFSAAAASEPRTARYLTASPTDFTEIYRMIMLHFSSDVTCSSTDTSKQMVATDGQVEHATAKEHCHVLVPPDQGTMRDSMKKASFKKKL